MTAKTIVPKAKAKYDFDMPSLRRRVKKLMRKKHKKTIKLSLVDKVWKEYVECGIIKPMIHIGKVQVDKNFSLEIIGRKVINSKQLIGFVKSGQKLKGYKHREGLSFKVECVDKNFKEGRLFFEPSKLMSAKVHEALENTSNYYRIV
jgi:hypothetical protein